MARLVMVAAVLGQGHIADAFNLANTTPNIIHDLVLGGVLGATFVPVFAERLARTSRREAIESISAVVTLATVLLVVTTVLFELGAPLLVDLYTFGSGSPAETHLEVELLRFFAPQLLCYGALSILGAVLAVEDRFAAVSIVPIINNLVGMGVLAAFAAIGHTDSIAQLEADPGKIVLLGLGTTLAVLAQALALLPSLRRSRLHLYFAWNPRDPAVRQVVSLSGWTFGFVATNQIAVFVVLALEYHLGTGNVSAYTYAFTFFQFPFGVAAAAIVNVATPDLARAWSAGDPRLMGQRFGVAIRQLAAVILPSMVAYLILARPAIELLLARGKETIADTHLTAAVLVVFALGLPGYCVYFLSIRALQAMQDTRTACWLYLLENSLNVGLAFAFYRPLGIRGLALSYGIAYSIGALVALVILRGRLGTIGGTELMSAVWRSLGLSMLMAVVLALASAGLGTGDGLFGWIRLAVIVAIGGGAYLGGAGVAGTLAAARRTRRAGARGGRAATGAHRSRH